MFFVLCGTQKSVLMYFNIFFKTHMAIISLDDFCLIIFFLCFEDYSYINIISYHVSFGSETIVFCFVFEMLSLR